MSEKNGKIVRIANWSDLGVIQRWIRNPEQLGKKLSPEGNFPPGTTLEDAESMLIPIRKKWTGALEVEYAPTC